MGKIHKLAKKQVHAALQRKHVNKLIVKLLELLIKHYATASVPETEEILNKLREVNDSVDIIARHLKRETNAQTEHVRASKKQIN